MMSVETASTAPGLALVRGGPFDLGRPRPPVDGDEETGDLKAGDLKPVVVGADGAATPAKRYACGMCPDGACCPWCHDRANHVKMSYAPLLLLPAGGLMTIGILLAFSGP